MYVLDQSIRLMLCLNLKREALAAAHVNDVKMTTKMMYACSLHRSATAPLTMVVLVAANPSFRRNREYSRGSWTSCRNQ